MCNNYCTFLSFQNKHYSLFVSSTIYFIFKEIKYHIGVTNINPNKAIKLKKHMGLFSGSGSDISVIIGSGSGIVIATGF
jgi:hypothetical protein